MKLKYILIFALSIAFMVGAFVFREQLTQLKSLGLLGIFLINFLGNATVIFPAPGIISVVAGGALYPPFLVAAVSALGGSFGDMVGFSLGASGEGLLVKKDNKWYMRLERIFKKASGIVIFLFAFIPNPLFDFVGIMAGAFRYSPIQFFLIMLCGRFARALLLAYFGSAMGFGR